MQRSPIITRQRSRTNPNIQNTPSTSTDVGEDDNFLFRIDNQLPRTPSPIIDLQTPESQIGNMEDISPSGVLNQTIEGTTERLEALTIQTIQTMETETPITESKQFEEELQQLRSYLIILAKASHHKTFMEICLYKKEAPKNLIPKIVHISTTLRVQQKNYGDKHSNKPQ